MERLHPRHGTLEQIRNNPDRKYNRRTHTSNPLSCAAYHTNDIWRTPDNVYFTFNPATREIGLPSGYIAFRQKKVATRD